MKHATSAKRRFSARRYAYVGSFLVFVVLVAMAPWAVKILSESGILAEATFASSSCVLACLGANNRGIS